MKPPKSSTPLSLCSRIVLLLLLAVPAGCTITTDGVQQAEVPVAEVFPPSRTVASYRQLAAPKRMDDDELEEQVGGKQKLAIMKKWSSLTTHFADYGIPNRPAAARVSVTELGAKTNAYGAYSNLRPGLLPDSAYMKIGVHATADGGRLIFVQDRFLIIIREISGMPEPARRTLLINFGRAISSRIPRDITDIALVGYLPFENRVPATERLDKEDPLGLGVFKAGGVTALYRIENREAKVFMAEVDTTALKGVMKDIRVEMEKEGPTGDLNIGEEGMMGRLFQSQAMLARREKVIFGCYGTMTEREMKNIMASIDRQVKPYVAPKIKERTKEDADEDAPKQPGR
jgi:hypothetical protein